MYQTLELSKVIIKNSAFYFGDKLLSNVAGPMMDEYLSHYTYTFEHDSWITGQSSKGAFTFDYKNTHDPWISEGYADFRFIGELRRDVEIGQTIIHSESSNGCSNFDPDFLGWYGDHIESQLVISSAAATCAAESISRTDIGKFHLNRKTLAELIGIDLSEVWLNSTSLSDKL